MLKPKAKNRNMKTLFIKLFVVLLVTHSCGQPKEETTATAVQPEDTAAAVDSTAAGAHLDTISTIDPYQDPGQKVGGTRNPASEETPSAIADTVAFEYQKTMSGPHVSAIQELSLDDSVKIDAPIETEQPKKAVLGFSYFKQIPQNETRDLRVFVKVQGESKQVAQRIREIEKQEMEFVKRDDSSVVCIINNIEAFKKLSIKPIFDEEDFKVTRIDDTNSGSETDPNEQMVDFVNGNYWKWSVKAIAKTPHLGMITLRIKAETPAGQKIQLAERQINIKIGIDAPQPTAWQKLLSFLNEHFKEILSLIIIPLAIYLFNLIRKRFSKNTSEQNDPKT